MRFCKCILHIVHCTFHISLVICANSFLLLQWFEIDYGRLSQTFFPTKFRSIEEIVRGLWVARGQYRFGRLPASLFERVQCISHFFSNLFQDEEVIKAADYDHVDIISLLQSDHIQIMLDMLYSHFVKEEVHNGISVSTAFILSIPRFDQCIYSKHELQFTNLFFELMVPEWSLAIFMEKYSMDRKKAVEKIHQQTLINPVDDSQSLLFITQNSLDEDVWQATGPFGPSKQSTWSTKESRMNRVPFIMVLLFDYYVRLNKTVMRMNLSKWRTSRANRGVFGFDRRMSWISFSYRRVPPSPCLSLSFWFPPNRGPGIRIWRPWAVHSVENWN